MRSATIAFRTLAVAVVVAAVWVAAPALGHGDKHARFAHKAGFATNAGLLDGQDSTAFAGKAHTHSGADIDSGTVAEARIDALVARDAEVFPAVLAADGSGSGLDADALDGRSSGAFAEAGVTDLQAYCDTLAEPGNYAPCNSIVSVVDDPANAVGSHTSLAIGIDGNPVISYHDDTDGALKVARCNDPACAGGDETITTVDDPANNVGLYSSIAIGTDGNPVISYQDATAGALKVARCNDPACAGANETITAVDQPLVGTYTSIAIGTDGNPVISYIDPGDELRVARCNDPACAGANDSISPVDVLVVAEHTSIAIGTDANPVIGYHNEDDGTLKVAKCNDPACFPGVDDETVTTVDDPANVVGAYTSLAIGVDGNPVISYFDMDAFSLKVAKCNDPACAGANETITTVDDPTNLVGDFTSIAIGADGNPVISYRDGTAQALKLARCNEPACAGMNEIITTVDDSANSVGLYTSIAIGNDGNPVISYQDATAGALKVARVVV